MCFFGVTICLPRKAENTWVVLTVVPFPEEPLMVQEAFLQGQMPTADPQSVCVVVVVGGEQICLQWHASDPLPLLPQAQDG